MKIGKEEKMISIFNRKELFITYEMRKQAEVRELMAQNKIPYSIKVINRKSPSIFEAGSRARTGTLGKTFSWSMNILFMLRRQIMIKQMPF